MLLVEALAPVDGNLLAPDFGMPDSQWRTEYCHRHALQRRRCGQHAVEDSDPYVVLVHISMRLKWKKKMIWQTQVFLLVLSKDLFEYYKNSKCQRGPGGWRRNTKKKTGKMTHNANPRGGPYLLFFQYRHLYTYVQTHRDGSHYYYHTSAHKRLLRAQGSPEGCQVLVAESVSVH